MKRKRPSARAADEFQLPGWDRLRHGGLLFDAARAAELAKFVPQEPLTGLVESRFRRLADALGDSKDPAAASRFVNYTLDEVCGFARSGGWTRGNEVPAEEGRRALTGELAKPRSRWTGRNGARLPVFFDRGQRLGVGKGRREMSRVVEWLRNGGEHLALLTNGREWRLVFAGLDYEAWCEWTVESFFEEGGLAPQVETLRALLSPPPWTPETEGKDAPLLRAIRDTRKGQAAVSEELGERVREAVEILIRSHGEPLKRIAGETDPADIYRAACRVAMRMVVVLYAESRDLLPRDNALYDAAYGLTALRDRLQRHEAAGRPLADRTAAWPRLLALFRLVHDGCSHSELPVTRYGGELFAPGAPDSAEGVSRALSVFETACFDSETASDQQVNTMLRLLTRTRIRVRKGRTSAVVAAPVDFSDLSSEYIGVLYEGLLDYELKTAAEDDPVVFLPVGDRPALPLSRLEEMEDRALKALFEKLKKPSSAADDAEPEEATAADAAKEDEPEAAGDADETPDDEGSPADEGAEYRERARRWALRAVEAARLVKKPRGRMTPERRLAREREIAAAAERLVARLVPPGEWYLVRWGGTRKGSGSFYTRPGLAIPTVQRTLRPLAFDPPKGEDGEPDRFAPGPKWSPKKPEDILRITVCDPACGSGTFPLAALRFLTDALYDSLRFHGRIEPRGEASLVRLLGLSDGASDRATEELIPAPPDADDFEPRLKAVLRRYVVERCIYAVDLDPLAVELCRLSLWIETMDRELPFGFLDHKIKCGNALIGAWFDQFRHYPVMAWKNREGGDKKHSNGVHFKKNARAQAIKDFVVERLKPDLREFLSGPTLFTDGDRLSATAKAHDKAQATLQHLHLLPIRDPAVRAEIYRKDFLGSPDWQSLKAAMDLWCSCWFWPPDKLDSAPLPTDLAEPSSETRRMAERVAAEQRFFHWELEFPDVFRREGSGFSAVLGNPPWENLQPNPEEYFSNYDPLFRSYGQVAKQDWLAEIFRNDMATEADYLDYLHGFRAIANWFRHCSHPFGDAAGSDRRGAFHLGARSRALHKRWHGARQAEVSYSHGTHPFVLQVGRIFTYQLFLEHSTSLLSNSGRCGFLVPSGIYSDAWSSRLRRTLLTDCHWEWLFGFENRRGVFPIHRSFKFAVLIAEKGGVTRTVSTAFMRQNLDDWQHAESVVIPYSLRQINRFSAENMAFLEVQSARDLDLLDKVYRNSVLLGDDDPGSWRIRYRLEFMMNSDARLFPPRAEFEDMDYRQDEYERWLSAEWFPIEALHEAMRVPDDQPCIPRTGMEAGVILSATADHWTTTERVRDAAVPLVEGAMVDQGSLRMTKARYLLRETDLRDSGVKPDKMAMRRIGGATNARTTIASFVSGRPCGDTAAVLDTMDAESAAVVLAALNSFVVDAVVRLRVAGTHVDYHVARHIPLPMPTTAEWTTSFAVFALRLYLGSSPIWSPSWIAAMGSGRRASGLWPVSAITEHERTRVRVVVDAVVAYWLGLDQRDLEYVLRSCDHYDAQGDAKGFWRVDKEKDPELRQTVLTLVAFDDLLGKIEAAAGNRDEGIEAFISQNDGEGWMLPETLRLADYGLGHDERARQHQPVASRLGPRFYDWQLVGTGEEREQEIHLHARNLLGAEGYGELLAGRIAKDASVNEEEGDLDVLIGAVAGRLEDDYTRRRLGDEGVAALVAELCPRAVPQRTQWPTFLLLLRSAGHLAPADCLRVLDHLLTRELITEPEHHRWSALGQPAWDSSANLLAAEPKHEFRLRSQRAPRKLFDD